MKTNFIRIKDKIYAIWVVLWCREFALFTCQKLTDSNRSTCILSSGVENKEKSRIFRECIAEYIMNFK